MFCYCQFQAVDPGDGGSAENNRRNSSFETTVCGGLPEKRIGPLHEAQTTTVSSTGSVLIFSHKQLSLKLHVKGRSNNPI